MSESFDLVLKMQKLAALNELKYLNEMTSRFGLNLSEEQILEIAEERFQALKSNGRIEFGEGILKKLIYAFCDSPYILQENYKESIIELQNSFYYFKNESNDLLSDDELIEIMKRIFNGKAQGSLDYLASISLEELLTNERLDDKDPSDHY